MKEKITYICEICGKKFDSSYYALKCEREHNLCDCKKYKEKLIYNNIVEYGKTMKGHIDYKNKLIKIYLDSDGCLYNVQETPICYCPICGDKL